MNKNFTMESVVPMKIAKYGYILMSIVLCALGIIRITMPYFSAEIFNILCGVVFIAFGCIRVIGFYAKDLYRLAFQYDFEFGILIIIFGILTLMQSGSFTSMTCVLLGAVVLADALFKIRITLEAKRFGIEKWWFLLAISMITSVLGGVLIFHFGRQINLVFGITLIAEGVLSLSTALSLVKIIYHQVKDE